MSDWSDLGPGDGPEDLMAAEYALGVLDLEGRQLAQARSDADPAFAQDVFAWIVRFAALLEAVPEAPPSSDLWLRIEAATAPKAQPLPPPTPQDPAGPAGGLWRTWAYAATAIAAAALLYIGLLARPGHTGHGGGGGGEATLVATLSLKDSGAAAVTVAYDPGRSMIYASPDADFSIPKSRSAELWLIPKDGKPRAVGVIDPGKPATMPMPPEFKSLAQDAAVLALSIEPSGGSPTGAPTGPVVASGPLTTV